MKLKLVRLKDSCSLSARADFKMVCLWDQEQSIIFH